MTKKHVPIEVYEPDPNYERDMGWAVFRIVTAILVCFLVFVFLREGGLDWLVEFVARMF